MNQNPTMDIKHIFYWGIAALALFALANPAPDLATAFTLVLITGVVVTHGKEIAGLLTIGGGTPTK